MASAGFGDDMDSTGDAPHARIRAHNGRAFILRPIETRDAESLKRAFHDMPPEDRYARTLSSLQDLTDQMALDFTHLDAQHEICVVIEDPEHPDQILGGARFMGDGDGVEGEFAVSLSNELKGQGLARQALVHVLDWARDHDYRRARGSILVSNAPMLGLARRLGFGIRRDPDDGQLVIATLDLTEPGDMGKA